MVHEKLLYKPSAAFEILDVGRSTGYALLASGALPSIRIGRSIRIPASSLKAFIEERLEASRSDEQSGALASGQAETTTNLSKDRAQRIDRDWIDNAANTATRARESK